METERINETNPYLTYQGKRIKWPRCMPLRKEEENQTEDLENLLIH